jgi:hypothetical protein
MINTSGFFDLVDSSTALIYSSPLNSDIIREVNMHWLRSPSMANKDHLTMFHESQDPDLSAYSYIARESDGAATLPGLIKLFNEAAPINESPCGYILNENRTLNTYVATVLTERPCNVLFKMSYHPGWNVTVNGREENINSVSPSLMAVPVEEGLSALHFNYGSDQTLRNWLVVLSFVMLFGLMFYDLGSQK